MPETTRSLMRFVTLRRLATAGDADPPPAQCKPPAGVFDFRGDLPEATREVMAAGDRHLAEAQIGLIRESITDDVAEAGRLAVELTRLSATNERLTVGDLESRVTDWAVRHGIAGEVRQAPAVRRLTASACALVTLRAWLSPQSDVARSAPAMVLRGVALIRLAEAGLSASCVVRAILHTHDLDLPDVPATPGTTGAADRARLARAAADTTRLARRAAALGAGSDPTLDELAAGDPSQAAAVDELRTMAEALGVSAGAPLSALQSVLEIEMAPGAGVLAGGVATPVPNGGVVPTVPYTPSVPALSAEARVLGRGDLMIVRTAALRYDLGDIAHIENVLASEVRSRVNVIDTSTSETVTESSTAVSQTGTELETTEHNSLDRATEVAASSASSVSAGVSISGGLGPVQAGLDVNASSSTTTSESNSAAVSFAKDVTEKASEMLRSEEESKRTTTTRTRIKETNEHAFDNSGATANIAGIYRWVDKVDQARVYNYGERLMLEFIVPEPAAQHVALSEATTAAAAAVPPPTFDLRPEDIHANNYTAKAALYQAQGLEAPPIFEQYVATTVLDAAAAPYEYPEPDGKAEDPEAMQPEWGYASYAKELNIPAGYEATKAYITVTWASSFYGTHRDKRQDIEVAVGDNKTAVIDDEDETDVHELTIDNPGEGTLPVIVSTDQNRGLAVGVRVRCQRTTESFAAWQLRTYETIQSAYLDMASAYDTAVRAQQARDVFVSSAPESVNRAVESRELKRGCQTILTGQDFDLFGAVSFDDDIPRISRAESLREATQIQFFEDCFEWDLLTYVFYPYQWAGRSRWSELLGRSSGDPLHEAFLQSGAARVVVPVREGYEHAVGHYLAFSEIPEFTPKSWGEGESPYPPIDELIADANDRPGDEVPIGDPWEVVTPTSLILLQETADLNPPDDAAADAGETADAAGSDAAAVVTNGLVASHGG